MVEDGDRLALRVQCLVAPPGKQVLAQLGVEGPHLVVFGDRRETHDIPILLRHHMASQIVPRVTPEGRLSCSRCMITMIEPPQVSFSRL
jgi:hypothetical protein